MLSKYLSKNTMVSIIGQDEELAMRASFAGTSSFSFKEEINLNQSNQIRLSR